jgi:hypothetical protein
VHCCAHGKQSRSDKQQLQLQRGPGRPPPFSLSELLCLGRLRSGLHMGLTPYIRPVSLLQRKYSVCSASGLFSRFTNDTCVYLKINKSKMNVLISVPLFFGTHVLIAIQVCSLYSQFSFSLLTRTARSYNGE